MILDPIKIVINNSYNWEDWEKALIKKCVEENPESSVEDLVPRLNMSIRTIYRKCHKYKIPIRGREIST